MLSKSLDSFNFILSVVCFFILWEFFYITMVALLLLSNTYQFSQVRSGLQVQTLCVLFLKYLW